MDARNLDRVPEVLRKVSLIPDQLRRFRIGPRQARSSHGIGTDLLETLVQAGLPCAGSLFDDYDLGNISLHLGLTGVRRMAIRSWSTALNRNSEAERTTCRVGYVPGCPVPGHPGQCAFSVLVPGGRRADATGTGKGTPVTTAEVVLRGVWPELPRPVRDLAQELDDLDFFLMPEAIRWDLGFMRHAGVADCGGVAKYLVREGRRRGMAVRFAFGFLVAKPYSTPHCWAEFDVDGTWVPCDPLLITAARAWGSLADPAWPIWRSPGAVFTRLCGEFTKVAHHGGIWSPLSLPTEVLP